MEGKHQPIVIKEEFEQVQKLLEDKSSQMEQCRKNRGVYSDIHRQSYLLRFAGVFIAPPDERPVFPSLPTMSFMTPFMRTSSNRYSVESFSI